MTTPTTAGGVPLLGALPTLDTTEFAVPAIHRPTGRREEHVFAVYRDPGSGVVVPLMRAKNLDEEAAFRSLSRLIGRALVDDDGLPDAYTPPTPTEDDPEPETDPRLEDPAEWSSKRRFYWLLDSEDYQTSSTLLEELRDWLVKQAMQRGGSPVAGEAVPTSAPASSRRGRSTKPRGSTAKR